MAEEVVELVEPAPRSLGPVGCEVGLLEGPLVAAVYLDVLLVVEE